MKVRNLLILSCVLFLLCGCFAQPQNVSACLVGRPADFIDGLWQGFIAPLAFICHLFDSNIQVWSVNNNGGWYMFGFLLGVGAFAEGGGNIYSAIVD